jgi:ankyrin repeat protein
MAHHAAAAYGHVEVLQYLVREAGAPVSAPAGEDQSTALHIAAEEGKLAAVRWLVEEGGADMHARDDYGRRPKYVVVWIG